MAHEPLIPGKSGQYFYRLWTEAALVTKYNKNVFDSHNPEQAVSSIVKIYSTKDIHEIKNDIPSEEYNKILRIFFEKYS